MSSEALIPTDPFEKAKMMSWLFWEQYSHEPNVATLRFWLRFVGEANLSDQQRAQMMPKRIAGCDALALMDRHLAARDWFVGDSVTLADIALVAYTRWADEGGFDLNEFPNVQRWVARVETDLGIGHVKKAA